MGMQEESKGQGHLIVGEWRWGVVYRKWRRHGWEALTVHEVGKKSAMVRSLRELEQREDEGEGRGFA